MQESFSTVHHGSPAEALWGCRPSIDAWYAYVAPGDCFLHPSEVLDHAGPTQAEKRAILAFWASDAHTVEDQPTLRCLVGDRAQPVRLDDILETLQRLDMHEAGGASRAAPIASRCHDSASQPRQVPGTHSTTLH